LDRYATRKLKSNPTDNLNIFQTTDKLYKAAAEYFIDHSKKSIASKGRFVVSLSGGQTPQKLYSLLAEPHFHNQVQWNKTFIFWGDERCVPLDDERNNAHQAKLILLDKIEIPKSNIHFIPVNLSPEDAAFNYEKNVIDFFGKEAAKFDLVLLGLGENGHTASLFPGTKVIDEQAAGVRAIYVKEEKMFRITMTAPLINQAHAILFLVAGENKSEILKEVLSAPYQPDIIPAQLITPVDGKVLWFVDSGAAALIKTE
jgi:6-phosphogluconolactonase